MLYNTIIYSYTKVRFTLTDIYKIKTQSFMYMYKNIQISN